jgi:hypothetical protein
MYRYNRYMMCIDAVEVMGAEAPVGVTSGDRTNHHVQRSFRAVNLTLD